MANRTIDFNQVGSLVQDWVMPAVADQVFLSNALYYRMRGRIKFFSGGRAIVVPLGFDVEGHGGQWWAGADPMDVRATDVIESAFFRRKNYSLPIVLLRDEEDTVDVNDMRAIMTLVQAKMDRARPTAVDAVGTALFNDGTDPKKIGGLALAIKDDPDTSHTYGGITCSSTVRPWWRNQKDATAYTVGGATDFPGVGLKVLSKMWGKIGRASGKKPTLIVSNHGAFNAFHNALVQNERYQRPQQATDLARAGFDSLMYRTAAWVVDERAPHSGADIEKVYFIHEPSMRLCVHRRRNMSFDTWREPVKQKARIAYIDWAGEMTTNERRANGVITSVDVTATS